ncbi:MAG: glycosyltransferase [Cyclobacteriaceae bacterium]|nr:glycosyltransferase [Cyclobacteriaceae bacterium]
MGHSKKKLIIFTNSYPYGNGYNWLDPEIEYLSSFFKSITIMPYAYEGNQQARHITFSENVFIDKPLLDNDLPFNIKKDWIYILSPRIFFYFAEFFKEQIFSSSYWFKGWLQAIKKTEFLLKSKRYKSLLLPGNHNDTVLYFYWGNNQSLMVPFLKKVGYEKILSRFHGYDLYKERLGGYQPFRRPLLKTLSTAAAISSYGETYLKKEYPNVDVKALVLRLGVKDIGRTQNTNKNYVHIVSCARIIRLKRVERIASIIKKIPYPVKWTHIGDGGYKYLVDKELEQLPDNVNVEFPGWMEADEVQKYYAENSIDLFISLSDSEGIPVSIMEALAAGIPVFSTDVGGISEIVDDTSGTLVSPNLSDDQILEKLIEFIEKYQSKPKVYQNNAYQRFLEKCDQQKCIQALKDELIQ